MADKKRVPAKGKKPLSKKTPKSETVETKTVAREEEEMEATGNVREEDLKETPPPVSARGNAREVAEEDEDEALEEERQPMFEGPRNGQGVRPQDVRLSDEYTIETFFDRNQRLFIATVVEYPELRCTGHTRDEAQVDLEERLEDHVYDLKARGGNVVDAVQSRQYPDKIEFPLSQTLYRKLDNMSRHEKLPLDRLVVELLTAAVERKGHSRPQQQQQHQHQQHHHNRDHHRDHGGHHNRHQGGGHRQHGGNRPQRGGGNFRALDSRENFMEYVRNLEKGGGSGWKKR